MRRESKGVEMSDFEKTMEEVFGDLHSRVNRQDLFFKLYNHMKADGISRNSELREVLLDIKNRYQDEGKYLSMKNNSEIWEIIKGLDI